MTGGVPPTLDVAGALVALFLTVREARRVRAGDRKARIWFVFFLVSAAVMTVIGVDALLQPPAAR